MILIGGVSIDKVRTSHEIKIFIVATFIVTWLIWSMAFLMPDFVITIGIFSPSVIGLICAYKFGGKNEIREMIRSLSYKRLNFKWVVYIFSVFPAMLSIAYIIYRINGGVAIESPFPVLSMPLVFFYILIFMGPLGEEFGWRGFALKKMLTLYSPLKSGLILGFVWSAWHIPLFFISGTIQHDLASYGLPIVALGYFLYTICISLLIVVVYTNTGGSVLASILFHTVSNISLGVKPIILERSGAVIMLTVLFLVTTAIVYLFSVYKNK